MKEIYFSTDHLTVGYQGTPLIKDICFSIKQGEILALIGPNGSGKTTIIKNIIRQLSPISGTISILQRDLMQYTKAELSQKMSVVLTNSIPSDLLTCLDVVSTGRYPYTGHLGILTGRDLELVDYYMQQVGIEDLKHTLFSKISDGQKQRVMLARALCQEPEILVLDEPTSYLDVRFKLEFLSILQKMAKKQKLTVILSLHELDLANRIADKIVCVKEDRIDRFGTVEEVFSGDYLSHLYSIQTGSYDSLSGNLELPAPQGSPRFFVFAGAGTGAPFFRKLQRMGIPFATGIIPENDMDYPVAKALATHVISMKPFMTPSDCTLSELAHMIQDCEHIHCTLPKNLVQTLPESYRDFIYSCVDL